MAYDEHLILPEVYNYVKNFTVAVDGGANRGDWTLELAKRFKRVLAFEPHGDAFYRLGKSTANLDNVRCVERALGERIREVGMESRRKVGFTDAHVVLEGDGTEMVTIDYYGLEEVGLIKLDLEGFEYFALKGAVATIKRCHPVVIVETIPSMEARYDLKPRQSEEFLLSMGYIEVYRSAPNRVYAYRGA